jgi:hypothetical protein
MTFIQILEIAFALGFLLLLVLLLRRFGGSEARLPYYSKEFLLSRGETAFYHVLRRSLPAHLIICPKVRLSDVLGCTGEGWKAGFGGKISQKHIDFVLADADNTAIALVIELDDRTHTHDDRRARDVFVDRALFTAGVPILRVIAAANYDAIVLRKQIAAVMEGGPFAPNLIRHTR